MHCPCNPANSYQQCCYSYHAGKFAPSALLLMRSRYSAYVLKLAAYLLDTWHPSTRPKTLDFDEADAIYWRGLTVVHHESTGENTATVEFIAEYSVNALLHRLHETSKFVLLDRWLYVDGQFD